MLALGCGDDSAVCQGDEACACFPNGTCNEGLTCASNFCVDVDGKEDSGVDGGPAPSGRGGSGARGSAGRGGNAGGSGSGGSAGSGGTVEQGDPCEESAECAPIDDACSTPVCISGVCDSASRLEGTVVDDGLAGNCQRVVCGPGGDLVTEVDPSDVPEDDGDACTLSACDGSMPVQQPAPQGTPTPASAQTSGDCLSVVCDGQGGLSSVADDGDVSAEPPGDPCKQRACDQGAPTLVNVTPGTPCGSGLVCDSSGACVACGANSTGCTTSAQCCGGLCQGGTTCAVCPQNMGDCDANTATGCEASFNSTTHCGRCGHDCTGRPYVTTPSCSAGTCGISRCEPGRADVDGEFENGCEGMASVGPNGAYAACTAGDTSACGPGERCGKPYSAVVIVQFNTCSASATDCFCGFPCSAVDACPAAPGGTAVPTCGGGYCSLSCDAAGSTCPTGMHCAEIGIVTFTTKVCLPD